jgi:hypothetical protein
MNDTELAAAAQELTEAIRQMNEHAKADDDLALFLRLQLHLENALTRRIKHELPNASAFDWDDYQKAPEFLIRVKLAYALAIIDKRAYGFCKLVAQIRNEFAHRLNRVLMIADYDRLVANLDAILQENVSFLLGTVLKDALPKQKVAAVFTLQVSIILLGAVQAGTDYAQDVSAVTGMVIRARERETQQQGEDTNDSPSSKSAES